ncbi:RecT family [uncultured Caudovirales phage]|uniref:RecT family n=1 Tax=uncultured Caudovirales phage TaxID=2100421 RepID=A0A6J5M484_9CAUD|nr:RecT family [uncultured Caudovirales phage]
MQLTTTNRGFAPATLTEAIQFSDMLASSSMVPKAYQGKPQDILVCVQWGYEMGLAPMQALQNIAVINGKPSVYGDAAMALVQASSVCEDVEEYFEGEGTPNPVAVCVAKRKGRKPVTAKFSVEDAKRAGLWGKQGPWQAYPKRMMQMRARGFALRDAFPDVLKGLITAEEAQDYPDEAKPRPAAKPANPLDMVARPEPVAIPHETSDRAIIEAAFADTVDPEPVEVLAVIPHAEEAPVEVEHVELQPLPDEPTQVIGFPLMVPGKTEPFSVHQSLDEWQDAYEDLADKTAKAGKRLARERMTLIRELREVNEPTLQRVDLVKRIRHTAAYSKRLNALGAAQ